MASLLFAYFYMMLVLVWFWRYLFGLSARHVQLRNAVLQKGRPEHRGRDSDGERESIQSGSTETEDDDGAWVEDEDGRYSADFMLQQ